MTETILTPRVARSQLRLWKRRREHLERKLKELLDDELPVLVARAKEAGLTTVEISDVAGVNRSTLYAKESQK